MADASNSPASSASLALAAFAGLRVLVADDAPDNRRLIAFILERGGASVMLAADGQTALDRAQQAWRAGKPFDLLLLDLHMPRLGGDAVATLLREAGYTKPIIAITGDPEPPPALAAGCDAVLSKPIDIIALAEAAGRLCV